MSKTTKQQTSSSSVNINGVPKAYSSIDSNGQVTSNYIMSPWEQEAYDYSQKEFTKNLPNVNVFSDETLKDLKNQVEAYKASGIKQINDIYSPMLKDLQNDVASRFGNLDNSVFLDKLNSIESKRADSVNALAQDVIAQEQSLMQNELNSRYDYLNFLNNYQNQVTKNAISAANTGNSLLNNSLSSSSNDSAAQSVKTIAALVSAIATKNPAYIALAAK